MIFNPPLIDGIIINRYKRFLCDIILEQDTPLNKAGDLIVAHIANTGSMKTCWGENWPVKLSLHNLPTRKLKYSVEMIHNEKSWILVNTGLTNKLVAEAIRHGRIPEFLKYKNIRPEVKVGDSRLDFFLSDNIEDPKDRGLFVEVKNVTLLGENNLALFPDAVTTRGQKHLKSLIQLKEQGYNAANLYIISREDCHSFTPSNAIDAKYYEIFYAAIAKGVKILAYQCQFKDNCVTIQKSIPIVKT